MLHNFPVWRASELNSFQAINLSQFSPNARGLPPLDEEVQEGLPEGRREEGVEDRIDTRVGVGQNVAPNLKCKGWLNEMFTSNAAQTNSTT